MSILNKLIHLNTSKGVVLGIDSVKRMAELLCIPHPDLKLIHVAGTNGKGSVCTKLYKYFQLYG